MSSAVLFASHLSKLAGTHQKAATGSEERAILRDNPRHGQSHLFIVFSAARLLATPTPFMGNGA